MVSIKNKIKYAQLVTGVIPFALAMKFLIGHSWMFLLFAVISLFIVVGTVPLFRRRENLYMFIFVAIAGVPINIWMSYWLVYEGFISSGFIIGDIMWALLLCCIFFSVEEIVFGVITRMIWRRQYVIKT